MASPGRKSRDDRAGPRGAESFEQSKEKRTEFLTSRQLADVLQISESTVHRLRRSGRIPAVVLTGRLIRFNLREVKNALRPAQSARDGEPDQDQEPSPQLSFEDIYSDFKIERK